MSGVQDRPLDEADLDPDPLRTFAAWFEEARAAEVFEPEAVALASAGADGRPSLRMVLNKGFDERGLTFFTNYSSRKADELEANPQAALLFHWPELGRQVRVEGAVERVTREETEAYARSRARGQPAERAGLAPEPPGGEPRVARGARGRARPRARRRELPVSEDWGGYRLAPEAWEFWQHRPSRLHDRFRYTPQAAAAG